MTQAVDQICGQFEEAWRQGEPISIEEAIQLAETADRNNVLDALIRLELSLRQAAGQNVSPGDYLDRFAGQASIVNSACLTIRDAKATVDLSASHSEVNSEFSGDFSFDEPTESNATAARSSDEGPQRKSIGRYTILDTLGRGGQADVFRAVHPTLPIEVAIKLTHRTLFAQARESLKEEAHILCDLDHPHIARVRDFDFDDDRPFMVLDFIRGRSLGQIAKSQPLTPVQAALMVARLSRAADYAHQRGVIHRDLKPDNVVIDETGEPKIIDFGMSRLRTGMVGDAQHRDEVSGTLAYMAPEQAVGVTSRTDHRVDIFALGAILYRLLVGRSPYTRLPTTKLLEQVRDGNWDRNALESAGVPERLKAICHRAMAMQPSERFANASELASALDELIVDPHASTITRRIKSKPWQKLVAIAGVFVGVVGFGYLATRAPTVHRSPMPMNPLATITESNKSGQLITQFDLIHIGNTADQAEFSGSLMQFRPPRQNDDIQVQAKFSDEVYCFLVALNPDGVKQLCYPADENTSQSEPVKTLRYPANEDSAFGLTDGIGQQAFVLYTSLEPLPAFKSWDSEIVAVSWPHPEASGNWQYREGQLEAFESPTMSRPRTRGAERRIKTPTAFKQMCDRMRQAGSTDVRGVLFEVQPKPHEMAPEKVGALNLPAATQ